MVLPFDLNEIEKYIREHEIALVIIDPFVAYLDPEINTHHDHDVRIALAKLKKLAEKTNVAIVLIRHLNKFGAGQALYRGSGSIGITGACRCALLAGKDPNDPDRFVLAGLKNNLGPLPESLAYHLEPAGKVARVEWEPEPCDLTAQDILWQPSRNSPRADAAEAWLRDQLSKHPVEAEVLYKAAEKTGHSKATLRRVKKKLGVATYLEGFGKDGVWMWQLPEVLTTK